MPMGPGEPQIGAVAIVNQSSEAGGDSRRLAGVRVCGAGAVRRFGGSAAHEHGWFGAEAVRHGVGVCDGVVCLIDGVVGLMRSFLEGCGCD